MDRDRSKDEYRKLPSLVRLLEQLLDVQEQAVLDQSEKIEHAVQALRESEQKTRLIVERAPDAFIAVSSDGSVLEWNAEAEHVLCYPRQQAINRQLQELVTLASPDGAPTSLEALLNDSPSLRAELNITLSSGTVVPVELAAFRVPLAQGFMSCAFLRDISQRRQAEAQKKLAEEEIQRLNEDLEMRIEDLAFANYQLEALAAELAVSRDQALEASRLKSEFLANMSHEIRTPLNGVVGTASILLRSDLSSKDRELVTIIHDSAHALSAIIDDILDFSKIEAGRLSVENIEFDLVDLVEGTAELMASKAHEKHLSLSTLIDPAIDPCLQGDPVRLRQILLNLIGNAIKFTNEGEIVVTVRKDGDDRANPILHFSVQDTGVGVPSQALPRLFQPFTQADGSITRRFGGTGLGLSICRRLVELMHGKIGVTSKEGQGSTFWFKVPLKAQPNKENPKRPADFLAGKKLLVIHGRTSTMSIVSEYLRAWGAHIDTTAGCNYTATITDRRYDLVIADADAIGPLRGCEQEDLSSPLLIVGDHEGTGHRPSNYTGYLTRPVRQGRLKNYVISLLQHQVPPEQPAIVEIPQERSDSNQRPAILLAEDNTINQKVARLQLEGLGFTCEAVTNGKEAVQAALTNQYQLVLMDCQMPVMDGFQATNEIRRRELTTGKHTPIIAMTAHAMEGDREKCLAAGMDDYISKPVSVAHLKDVLRRWLPSKTDKHQCSPALKTKADGETIDLAPLVELCSEEELAQILDVYVATSVKLVDTALVCVRKGDHAALKDAAHQLKGSSASVGAKELSRLSKNLELAAENADFSAAKAHIEEIKREFNRVMEYIKPLLDRPNHPANS